MIDPTVMALAIGTTLAGAILTAAHHSASKLRNRTARNFLEAVSDEPDLFGEYQVIVGNAVNKRGSNYTVRKPIITVTREKA